MSPPPADAHPVVLFDGLCNLCDASIRFIVDHDPQGIFHFAPLQSDVSRGLLAACPEVSDTDSVVLVEGDRCYLHSTAALRIFRRLRGGWRLLSYLRIVPRPLRDAVYHLIARNRHRWFGRREQCRIPTPEEQERFLS